MSAANRESDVGYYKVIVITTANFTTKRGSLLLKSETAVSLQAVSGFSSATVISRCRRKEVLLQSAVAIQSATSVITS